MARLKGIPEHVVIRRHALRNALVPLIQGSALTLIYLTGGIVTVEYLFAYPGSRERAHGCGAGPGHAGRAGDRAALRRRPTCSSTSRPTCSPSSSRLGCGRGAPVSAATAVAARSARRARRRWRGRSARPGRGSGSRSPPSSSCSRWSGRLRPRTTRPRWSASPTRPRPGSILLGTDYLGHDVLSRVLWGGRSVVWMAFAGATLGVGVGAAIGLLAGYSRSRLDDVLMRGMDVILAFPQIVLILLFVSIIGTKLWLIVLRRRARLGAAGGAGDPRRDRRDRAPRVRRVGRGDRAPAADDPAPRDPPERDDAADGRVRPAADVVDRPRRGRQLPRLRHPAAERRLGPDDQREPPGPDAQPVGGARAGRLHRGLRGRHELRHRGHRARRRAGIDGDGG